VAFVGLQYLKHRALQTQRSKTLKNILPCMLVSDLHAAGAPGGGPRVAIDRGARERRLNQTRNYA
jgi:hypothetical protein